MTRKKIKNIIFMVIFFFILINTFVAYFSYKEVCDNKTPKIGFKTVKKGYKTEYNLLIYKVILEEKENKRTVSLKLFFLN